MLTYKGYTGKIEIDTEAGLLFGRVLGLRDVITFQGATVPEAQKAFEDSVDAYLKLCDSRGESPERPFSGKFLVRIPPELHKALSAEAERRALSLNALVERLLAAGVGEAAEAEGSPAGRPGPKPRRRRAV